MKIPRATELINPVIFEQLVQLSLEFTWLQHLSIPLAELWNFCQSNEERRLIKDLISRMVYLDSKDLYLRNRELKRIVTEDWKLSSIDSFFVAFSNKKEADGSQHLLQSLKSHFGGIDHWKERNFKNTIGAIHEIANGSNIILVDDFVGTGKTFNTRVEWVQENLYKENKGECRLYFYSIATMEETIQIIKTKVRNYYIPVLLRKGISDYYDEESRSAQIKLMELMESRLGERYNRKRLKDFNFGYRRSEALYSHETCSTPNNTFPIFWWPILKDKSKWNTIFNRL